jgi:hypothetical protein
MTGIAVWACAATGNTAAAPPKSVMNSRRFIANLIPKFLTRA